jgi:hydrophobic/amphiphilic exporter-1 (mainly G- bacteria), HAE1 family
MNLVQLAVRQPVTVAVGVLLILLSGILAIRRIPIQLTPNVEDTIIAVTTRWEGASPVEVEQEIVDTQEEKLQGLAGLRSITSSSQQGQAVIRLEFIVGTPKDAALREVSDKLREVPSYPDDVDEPVIEASDPENQDYIAWVVLSCTDPDFDVRTLQDFGDDRIKPRLERIPGISEINVLGGREREVQVRYDPARIASKGITPAAFAAALRLQNRDTSAGALAESKMDVRVRLVGQFTELRDVEDTVIAFTAGGPVRVRDVAEVVETFKEQRTFVRACGEPVLAINAQKEVGANVMEVMEGLRGGIEALCAEGGLLDTKARKLGLKGKLELTKVYDQTIYIDDALGLVRSNIWIGGVLATIVLLIFLRSLRTAGIVALAIPISVVGAVVVLVALGRSINVISLAGMAFAVGMVVDNAIVVLENIYRHLEMGKAPAKAAVDGGREVFGAVLASTLTTVLVFVPILLIEEEAGQLFRDISLAIVAAVSLSFLVSITVIPSTAARLLRAKKGGAPRKKPRLIGRSPDLIAAVVDRCNRSVLARVGIVLLFATASVLGTWWLIPPTDYLPQGNRNLVFGLMIPPPGYNLEQQGILADRIESTMRPFWEAARTEEGSPEREAAIAGLDAVPTFDHFRGIPGEPLVPPALSEYFLVSFDGIMFHGGVSEDSRKVVDILPLFTHATRAEVTPGVLAFAFQIPLFQLGGSTGSAIKINFSGDDLEEVAAATESVLMELMGRYSPYSTQPDPSNFNVPTPELRLFPDPLRRAESGLSHEDLVVAVQTLGEGALVGEFRKKGDAIDLKLISRHALEGGALDRVIESPIATPGGSSVPLSSVTRPVRTTAAQQINRVGRQRSITLQFTPPTGMALEQAVREVAGIIEAKRNSGAIGPDIESSFTGSASKLEAVQEALLGDGSWRGALNSSLVLALLVVYLLLCVLFQSFVLPLVIMISVPLATLGGFAALRGVYLWSLIDPYLPIQQLDILTMLGFVLLIGVVVNNAILIVHQTMNFMRAEEGGRSLPAREAITEAVRSRVRPIFMSTLTSVGGMAPLVFMPGAGSELYRGLGSVVVGGLLVSTVFTLLLVPLLLSLALDLQTRLRRGKESASGGGRSLRGVGETGVLLLSALLLFPACRGASPDRRPVSLASRVAQEILETVPRHSSAMVPHLAPSEVPELLADRLEELDEIGGPASWSSLAPSFGDGLFERDPQTLTIGLEEVVRTALENNLGLRVARLGEEAEGAAREVHSAAWDPIFFADFEYEEVETPSPVPVIGGIALGASVSAHDRGRLQAGVRRLLRSGATVSATSFYQRYEDDSEGIDFEPNPAWRLGFGVEARQPLLRGFGEEVTTREERHAILRQERSREELQAEILAIGALVEQAYWNLYEARDRLLVQQRFVREGEEVKRVLRERQTFDTQPAQYADAIATVEKRRADLIRARDLLRRASDDLKALLDREDLPPGSETLLLPLDAPDIAPMRLDPRAATAAAIANRPELRAALVDIEDAGLRERVAANLRRPGLDVSARLDLVGEDDRIGSATGAAFEDDHLGFLVGLHFELPVGNRAASAEERRAQIDARRSLLLYRQLARDILHEVRRAQRDLATSFELIGATRAYRIAQAENLRTLLVEEEKRSRLTPEFLTLKFNRQERLHGAQLEELQAIANYRRAEAAYRRAIGAGPLLPAAEAESGEGESDGSATSRRGVAGE